MTMCMDRHRQSDTTNGRRVLLLGGCLFLLADDLGFRCFGLAFLFLGTSGQPGAAIVAMVKSRSVIVGRTFASATRDRGNLDRVAKLVAGRGRR